MQDFEDTFITMVREVQLFVDIRFNPLASIDKRAFFARLCNENANGVPLITKVIWIPRAALDHQPAWMALLPANEDKEKLMLAVRAAHHEYYALRDTLKLSCD